MRFCKTCEQWKPMEAFNKTNSPCKECFNAAQRKSYWQDPETERLRQNLAYNTPEVQAKRKQRREDAPKKEILRKAKDFMTRYMLKTE